MLYVYKYCHIIHYGSSVIQDYAILNILVLMSVLDTDETLKRY